VDANTKNKKGVTQYMKHVDVAVCISLFDIDGLCVPTGDE